MKIDIDLGLEEYLGMDAKFRERSSGGMRDMRGAKFDRAQK